MQINMIGVTQMSGRPTLGVWGSGKRVFGGQATTQRRARSIAYAWRQWRKTHHDSGCERCEPFMFTLVGASRRRDGSRSERSIVGFVTAADRERGIRYLIGQGHNHFTLFRDVNATFALQFGVGVGSGITINR